MTTEAASQRLNYMDKKARAISSRASRTILAPSGSSVSGPNGVTTISIPGNQVATFLDFQNTYLRFTIKNNSATHAIRIESAWALISTLEILSDGQTISSIANYGAAVHQYLKSEVGQDWAAGVGKGLAGISQEVAIGTSLTVAVPLVLTCLFSSNKYIPLGGRSTLQIRITWQEASTAYVSATALVNEVVYGPIDLIASTIRLSAEANSMVNANCGGRYELICSDTRSAVGLHNVATGTAININCGFSFSSLNRISYAFYPTYRGKPLVRSVSNLGCGGITNVALSINGEEFPRKRVEISATNIAESIAELCIAHRSLADFNHNSQLKPSTYYLENPLGTVDNASALGSFVGMLDTESMMPHGDNLYSGLSTLGSVVSLVGNTTATTGGLENQVLIFADYTMAMTLDMNGTQTWVVSI
jgi:hypothetical protein